MTVPTSSIPRSIILTLVILLSSYTKPFPMTSSSPITRFIQGNALVDLVGLVLNRPTSLATSIFESSILALVVEFDRETNRMIIKPWCHQM